MADVLPPPDRPALLVICVDVCDPANLGGILRNAAAFGADAVLLNDRCTDPFSRRVLRASMGATLKLPVATVADIEQALRALGRDYGVELVAAVVGENAEPLRTADRPSRLGLVIGNEGQGLDSRVVDCCGRSLAIPMQPDTDSLNAAVASGVFLHHFVHSAGRQDLH
jgi:tRNA G18 (ribose-2'-O)-methylase SpoU